MCYRNRISSYLFHIFLIIKVIDFKFRTRSQDSFLCLIVLLYDFQFRCKFIIQQNTPYLRFCRLMFCDAHNEIIHRLIIMGCCAFPYKVCTKRKWNGNCIPFFVSENFCRTIFSDHCRFCGRKIITSILFYRKGRKQISSKSCTF